jgi:hypothetical protein
MQYLIGVVIGIAICYGFTLLYDYIEYIRMGIWLEEKGIDIEDESSQRRVDQYMMMYKLSKLASVEIDLIQHKEESKDGE